MLGVIWRVVDWLPSNSWLVASISWLVAWRLVDWWLVHWLLLTSWLVYWLLLTSWLVAQKADGRFCDAFGKRSVDCKSVNLIGNCLIDWPSSVDGLLPARLMIRLTIGCQVVGVRMISWQMIGWLVIGWLTIGRYKIGWVSHQWLVDWKWVRGCDGEAGGWVGGSTDQNLASWLTWYTLFGGWLVDWGFVNGWLDVGGRWSMGGWVGAWVSAWDSRSIDWLPNWLMINLCIWWIDRWVIGQLDARCV